MKTRAIHFPSVVLEGITPKKDKSLTLRFSTPEMKPEEMTVVWEKMGILCDLLVQPEDEEFPDIIEVKGEMEKKPLSQRLRGSLFVLWDKRGRSGEFDTFYRTNMEKFIERIKSLIDEEEV